MSTAPITSFKAIKSTARSIKKRRLLLLCSLTVGLPLVLMISLQYWWLLKLKVSSNLARDAVQDQFLGLVSEKVRFYYQTAGEQLLDIPAETLVGDPELLVNMMRSKYTYTRKSQMKNSKLSSVPESIKSTSTSRSIEQSLARTFGLGEEQTEWPDSGISMGQDIKPPFLTVFAQSFVGKQEGKSLFIDPTLVIGTPSLVDKDLEQTINWVCMYWSFRAKEGKTEERGLVVDERNPDYPMIINPVLDDTGALVGVLGVVIGAEYFCKYLVPSFMKELEPVLQGQKDWSMSLYDHNNDLVMTKSAGRLELDAHSLKTKKFDFVFSHWSIGMSSKPSRLEQLAGANFWLNMALSGSLVLALLGGITFTLRTASHEIRLSEMKSDFVSNVSHELRTPLASIRVFGELLRLGRTTSPEKVREYGAYIENEGRRLSRLINNILDFSKIESGQKLYHFEEVDLESVLMEVITTFEVRNQETQTAINYMGPDHNLPLMQIDADAIGQVFYNLLDNGVKYSRDLHRLEVGLAQEGKFAKIWFTDFGVGIAEEELDKIFERFHRVSTQLVHDVKGNGLGLSIVRHVVEAHHGTVTVQSTLGEGSTFTLLLPIEHEMID